MAIDRTTGLLIVLGMAAALYAVSSRANDSPQLVPGDAPQPPQDGTSYTDWGSPMDNADTVDSVQNPPSGATPLAALLGLIRTFESNGQYNVITGGQHFDSYADHPRVRVPFYNPRRPGPKGTANDWSDAAGAYQFISTTWDQYARRLGLGDFSPASQDAAAAAYLADLGATAALDAGDVQTAIVRASRAWASLPGSTAGQGARSMQAALDTFNTFTGVA